MDILIVAQYFGNIEQLDKSNNRFVCLASLLAKQYCVEVLTTSFVHAEKRQGQGILSEYNGFKITALSEPGYNKNVCIKRIHSHKVLAKEMSNYLKKRKKPDIIYCAVPSLDCAYVAAKYAEKNNIPFIVDIQDLWPEAFKLVFNIPIIKDIVFMPMNRKANFIYSRADYIIGVSKTYCDRAKKVNHNAKSIAVFLGTNLDIFDENVNKNKIIRNDEKVVLGYCGTLGHSYDLKCVFDALQILKERGNQDIEFWIMGSGPLQDIFSEYVAKRNLDVKFWGRLPYEQMCGVLSSCDICINPISKGAAQSIINKHADYAASGIPVINTQECIEYRSLIEEYKCGINCECADSQSVAEAIEYMIEHKCERQQKGINARNMAESLFNRKYTYTQIVDIINEVVLYHKEKKQ